MATVSASLNRRTIDAIEMLVKQGIGSSRIEIIRKAVEKYLEYQAVEAVLRAEKEPTFEGDLDELAERFGAS